MWFQGEQNTYKADAQRVRNPTNTEIPYHRKETNNFCVQPECVERKGVYIFWMDWLLNQYIQQSWEHVRSVQLPKVILLTQDRSLTFKFKQESANQLYFML